MTQLLAPDGMRHLHTGKVRDLFELPGGRLLMVASDRISAYDWVLATPIPDKGRILTQLSLWWFERLAEILPNHVVATEPPIGLPSGYSGRTMVCERLSMIEVECVARGYLAGSGYSGYRRTGEVCGVRLPGGLQEASRLPEPVFTPTTKAPLGQHDEPMTYEDVVAMIGAERAAEIRRVTLAVYARGQEIAADRGVVIADTKIELGVDGQGRLVLADEVLTPDSSRFWPADAWEPGRPQPSYDKQFVRDWLVSPESGWSQESGDPPPPLPEKIVAQTRARYIEAYERLTGRTFAG